MRAWRSARGPSSPARPYKRARLVDDLLEVARVNTGKVVIARAPLELADAVERCVAQLEARTQQRTIELEVDGGPHWIHGDPVRAEQIGMPGRPSA